MVQNHSATRGDWLVSPGEIVGEIEKEEGLSPGARPKKKSRKI